MTRDRTLLALTVLALLVTVPGTPPALRVPVVTAFFLIVPGLAWVRRLPVHGPLEQATVAVAISLALAVVVSETLLLLGVAGLLPAALVLGAFTVVGVLVGPRSAVPA
jgi:hypothetical protein